MRKIVAPLAAVLVALGALGAEGCRSAGGGSADGGAVSSTGAVQEFLAAARGGDVRTMATLFGTSNGSINAREDANDVEKRMRSLQCYLTHDAARVTDDLPAPSGAGRRVTVELRQRNLTRRTDFTVVPGPHRRWFVESFDIQAVADLCHP